MTDKKQASFNSKLVARPILGLTLLALSVGCHKPDLPTANFKNFKQVNLVANLPKYHPVTVDPTLLNGFGMAWSPNGVAWVNSVGGHVSELYSAEGAIVRTPVNIPSPTDTIGGFPCGIVFSGGTGFNLSNGPSAFLFTGFDGVLSGWNGGSGNNAKRLRASAGNSYTGLALASNAGRNFIYGANFGAKKIDVWDTAFNRIPMSFRDPQLPETYSPYNIQAVGGYLFVMYAELSTYGENAGHGIGGAGKGYVSVFNTDGSFLRRFASKGSLNIPWGIASAPASFLDNKDIITNGKEDMSSNGNNVNRNAESPILLVGNFGDGRINVFSEDAKYLGQLKSNNQTIAIDGLWALSFAPATATTTDPNRLYFTAGPNHEMDGLFGYLIKQ
jgi:uncharacterized protein (TIGR03118 family)